VLQTTTCPRAHRVVHWSCTVCPETGTSSGLLSTPLAGPKADVALSCFNGQDGWMTFAGQLDYTVPAPEVNTGVATPSVASIASALGGIGNDTGSKTYRCIKQYTILGSSLDKVQVGICSMCLEE